MINLRKWATIGVLISALSSWFLSGVFASEQDKCSALLTDHLDIVVKMDRFTKNRSLGFYLRAFGDGFAKKLRSLGSHEHWVDLGCGNAMAVREYHYGKSFEFPGVTHDDRTHEDLRYFLSLSPSDRAKTTGISYEYHFRRAYPELRVISGNFFEKVPSKEVGQADLITDMYGVLAYTSTFDSDLKKSIDLLSPTGELYLFLGHYGEFAYSKVTLASGEKITLIDWMKRIPGIEVQENISTRMPLSGLKYQPDPSLRITRKSGFEHIQVPRLKLIDIQESRSPVSFRYFIELQEKK